jgi:cardiolipin-specific phospholipase
MTAECYCLDGVRAMRHHRHCKSLKTRSCPQQGIPRLVCTYTHTRRHTGRLDRASNIPPLTLRSSGASLLALPVSLRSALFLAATLPFTSVPIVHAQGLRTRHQHTMASESSPDLHAPSQKPMLARHREQDGASGQAQAQSKGAYFPLGYKEGFSQWWTSLAPAVTEHKVLSYVPYLQRPPTHTQTGSAPPSVKGMKLGDDERSASDVVRTTSITDPYGPRQWNSEQVQLSGKSRSLNEFSVVRTEESVDNNLVMLHGYGAGLGFFYKNFEGLSRRPNWKLYALDMLGMGRSSRPSFKIHAKEKEDKIKEAESWFVDALEEWRIKRGIEKMTLLGHSLGGYMAVAYALKYPGHLNKLILASPVGIPEDPYAVNQDLPEPEDSRMQNEFTQSQEESIDGANAPDNNNFLNARSKAQAAEQKNKPPPRKLPKWLVTLWDANVSPFSIVRYAGPLGPRLVSGWTSRRFSQMPPEEAQALHDYSYSLFRQRGSGEYALAYILAPGAFARSPLIRRIQGVGRQYLEPHSNPTPDDAASSPLPVAKVRETGVPVVLMYGEHDWMDVAGGHAAMEKLNAEKRKALANATEEERARENGHAKVTMIRKAGHHVYLDGWEQFNEEMLEEMKDVEKRQQRLKALEK